MQTNTATAPAETLVFTYWGSPVEKAAVEKMVRSFEAANPNIKVEAIHFPIADYVGRLSAMIAGGKTPDVAYLLEIYALQWASEGHLLDLTDIIQSDPELSARLPETFYYYAPGRTIGTNTAVEIAVMFYNRDLFDQAGLPYPPARPEAAWTWDEFVRAAQQLTVDTAGRRPYEPGFDPEAVQVYGVRFDKAYWVDYYAFIYSNGGQFVDETGTQLLLDQPEAVEAIQKLRDLVWVERVTPTPAQDSQLPSADVQFQTGQVAMVFGGQWKLLDYANMQDFNLGLGVLPKMKFAKTIILGSPTVIFADTPHLEAAIKFYKYHNDPRNVDLFARGLWMPLNESYYTSPADMALWLDNAAHPPEARHVLVDYTLCCAVRVPHYYVKHFPQVMEEAIQPAMDAIWTDSAGVEAAMRQAAQAAAGLLGGRWDR